MSAMGDDAVLGARLLNALPHPVLALGPGGDILDVNLAAEAFFDVGRTMLLRQRLSDLVPFASPVLTLVEQVLEGGPAVNEYRVDVGSPRIGPGAHGRRLRRAADG